MNKILAILLMMSLMITGILPAMAENSSLADMDWSGRWEMIGLVTADGTVQNMEENGKITAGQMYFDEEGHGVFSLLANGTVTYAVSPVQNCWVEENVLHCSKGNITYYPELDMLVWPLGGNVALVFQKIDWTLHMDNHEIEAGSVEDYYGIWEEWATDGVVLDFDGVIGGDLNKAQVYFELNENGGQKIVIRQTDDGLTYFSEPISEVRVKEGVLQIHYAGDDPDFYFGARVYDNGWISLLFNSSGTEYKVYFRRNDQVLDYLRAFPDYRDSGTGAEQNPADTDAADQSAGDAEGRVMHTARGGLEVKASASRSAKKVVTLKKDREVTVLGMEGDWYYIEVDLGNKKVQGYVPADSLK